MKKFVIGLGVFLVLIIAVLGVARKPIGSLLYGRMIEARMGMDPFAALPDGLHVKVCGAGSPMPDPARAAPCLLVIAGKQQIMVDVGAASVRALAGEQVDLGNVSAVLLTHFHSDHIDGLGELQMQRWAQSGSVTPLPVYGPAGVDQVVDGINQAYALDTNYRVAHHGEALMPRTGAGLTAQPFTLPDNSAGVVFNNAGLKVTAITVDHEPVAPAVAYRFDYKGRSIVISGDAAPDARVTTLSGGVDILFHEALNRDLVKKIGAAAADAGNQRVAKIMDDIQTYHTSPEEAARIAEEAQANALVLYHLVPAIPAPYLNTAFLGDANSYFSGEITIAEDGMVFTLPAKAN